MSLIGVITGSDWRLPFENSPSYRMGLVMDILSDKSGDNESAVHFVCQCTDYAMS